MTLAKKIIPLLLIKCIIAFSPKADYKRSYSRIRNDAITTVAPALTELPCWHNSRIKRHCSHHSMVGNHVASVVNIVSRGGNNNSFLRNLHTDQTFVLSAILLLSSFGVTLEKKTQFGKALSVSLQDQECLSKLHMSITFSFLGRFLNQISNLCPLFSL